MKLYKVQQKLVSNPLADIPGEVTRQLDALKLDVPGGEVAVTAGSRGIANIPLILRGIGDWLSTRGATPFVVPCMGSHNGATAEGQEAMLASLGITRETTGMEIRSSMDVVKIGSVKSGDVYMDRHCHEADGVIVANRIKLHTTFAGPVQSGLAKMIVVGMGKIDSARTFHAVLPPAMSGMLVEMSRVTLNSGKILAGLAILEDGYDRTAELHALRPEEILEEEPGLLERHRHYFPRLPVDDLNVLVVNEMGKIYSGTGMDTNVLGYRGIKGHEDLDKPKIGTIAVLNLAAGSHGNALGVGLADFITQRLRDDIDEKKTFLNVLTSGYMLRGQIPLTLDSDEDLVKIMLERFGEKRWMFIPNTLHLETLYVSEDIAQELEAHPECEVTREATPLVFGNGCHQLVF